MRRIAAPRVVALVLAPAAGWAVFNALALPILTATSFTRATVAMLSGAAVLGGLAVSRRQRPPVVEPRPVGVSVLVLAAAALLAVVPALAVWPKFGAGGIVLSEAMFDHSKAAIIDDIIRLGLPPGNPFFAGSGPRLVYYYLWHFSAAIPATIVWRQRVGSRYRADLVHRFRLAVPDDRARGLVRRTDNRGILGGVAQPLRIAETRARLGTSRHRPRPRAGPNSMAGKLDISGELGATALGFGRLRRGGGATLVPTSRLTRLADRAAAGGRRSRCVRKLCLGGRRHLCRGGAADYHRSPGHGRRRSSSGRPPL